LIIGVLIVGGIFIFRMLGSDGGAAVGVDGFRQETYKEKVMTVAEIERSQPTKFLSATGQYRTTLLGNKIKVDCTITNKATVATYKDAIVRVTYYSKTKTVLGTNDYTIYEVFPPTSSKTVRLKIDNYKNVATIGWDVIMASNN